MNPSTGAGGYFLNEKGYKVKITLKYAVIFCLAAVVFSSLLVSCTTAPAATTPAELTVTDQLGRVVTVPANPQRIISIAPSNTEILFALGLGDRVVGVTTYCDYPPEALDKPKIGDFSAPSIEEIVAAAPDLILAANIHKDVVVPRLEDRGLTVVALSPDTVDAVLEAITLVGKVTGKDKEAANLVKSMEDRIKAVTDKTDALAEAEKPRIFYVVWHDPLMTAGSGTFMDELIYKAGGTNIAHDLDGYPDIDLETVIASDPQVIVAGVGMGEGQDLPLQFLMEEDRLKNTEARRNNRIYPMDMDIIGRPGPRLVDALEQFARFLHPALFGE
jgi:iron complex transport system substrate-binding protein